MGKKVLMVLDQEFPPDDRVYKEAQSLIKEGFKVSIACYTFDKNKPDYEVFDNITIYRKPVPNLIYKSSVAALKVPVYFSWWKKYLNSIFKKETFDIIHIHDLPLAKVGAFFKKRKKLKLVVDLHENWPSYLTVATHTNTFLGKILSPNKDWVNYEKSILHLADAVITVVDEMKQRIIDHGLNQQKVFVLQNTIIPEKYPRLDNSKDENNFTLFFAGGINIERGLQYVIPALALVKNKIKNLKLNIVGKGSYLPTLEKLVNDNNLNDIVSFLGWKPLQEVLNLTAKADVTLIPHIKWEQTDCSSPNKLFQCMLAGVPLLVSNCDSIARIVNETNSGVSYTFDNINEFAEKLEYLYQNPEKRKIMGENGTNSVLKKYNWDNTTTEFINMYKSL